MNSRATTLVALVAAAIFSSGCASGATARGMSLAKKEITSQTNPVFAGAMGVAAVEGGKDTNPAWTSQIDDDSFKEALTASLQAAGLLGEQGDARYEIRASLVGVEQPFLGFDMTVTTTVRYSVKDLTTGAVVFEESISAPHTATVGDAFVGTTRLRLANEGSAKKNIVQLIEKLNGLALKVAAVTVG
jgi:hypothetical protein